MLILSRKVDEQIQIGNEIVITITDIRKGNVKVGIDAPKDVPITRPLREAGTSEIEPQDAAS